jgi:hypothetical protein
MSLGDCHETIEDEEQAAIGRTLEYEPDGFCYR